MLRKLRSAKLVIASHNAGKVREITELLAPHGVDILSAAALGLPEPEETGTTFAENAEMKAKAAAAGANLPALADDSGLCVDALDGAPGIFSARWAGVARDFGAAMARVHAELARRDAMEGAPVTRAAHFVCALALTWPDGYCELFEGRVFGTLVWPPRGNLGFGYDPMFVPHGHERSFGELAPEKKHAISHRAQAFRRLIDACFN